MTTQDSLRIALYGAGPEAQRWAWALAEHASLDSGSLARANAVVLAPGALEPLSTAREALSEGLPVLWACGQLPQLQDMVRPASYGCQEALLSVYEPFLHTGGFGLLRRFLRGPEPFWRPVYLRIVAGPSQAGGRLEDVALNALAKVQALRDIEAEQVTAQAAQQEDGETPALILTVQYRGGLLLQCTASLAETREELVVITRDRKLTLDGDVLRIALNGADCPRHERVLSAPSADPIVEEARRFAEAVSKGDALAGNSDRWLKVVDLWSAVRTSLNQGGPVWLQSPAGGEIGMPPFTLIHGGGRKARIASSPKFTLVAS